MDWIKKIFPGPILVPHDLRAGAYQQIEDIKQLNDDETNIYQEIHAEETDRILRIADSYDENDAHLFYKKFSFSYYHTSNTKPYFLNPFIIQNLGITISFFDVGLAMVCIVKYSFFQFYSNYLIILVSTASTSRVLLDSQH